MPHRCLPTKQDLARVFLIIFASVALVATGCGSDDQTDNDESANANVEENAGHGDDVGVDDAGGDNTGEVEDTGNGDQDDVGVDDVGPEDVGDDDVGVDAGDDAGLTCDEGLLACGEECVDTDDDNLHCGECFNACDGDLQCFDGACGCDGELEVCSDNQCVDTSSNFDHCGECDEPCEGTQVCNDSTCQDDCDSGLEECSGACVDTDTSDDHCGDCGEACDGDLQCSGGSCGCESGLDVCNENQCVDFMNDDDHCGECGEACDGDLQCSDGSCECADGLDVCNENQCVDFMNDDDHCGDCNESCDGAGETCVDGQCEGGSDETSFADDVVPIFSACTGCHGGSGGLTLSSDPYGNLVDVEAGCDGNTRVIPGDPDESYLVRKLEGGPDICGGQMPQGGTLPSEDIDTIRQWIDEGALDN